MTDEPQGTDLAAQMARIKAQRQDDPLAMQMARVAARKKPRGYRTPEQIARLNKIDAAVDELGPVETIAGGAAATGHGLTLGWGDELAALARSVGNPQYRYRDALRDVRAEQDIFAKEYPKADVALNMAGSVLVPVPVPGKGAMRTGGNAALLGGTAGAGYADGDLADRLTGAGIGAGTALAATGLLGALGAGVRGTGSLVRRVREAPNDKALAYLRKLAILRGSGDLKTGLFNIEADVAAARAAGGQPVLAEGVGESGVRGLLATTKAPLAEAGEVARATLGARGKTVLPRADEAALATVGAEKMLGVRGPEYLNDWIAAIRSDETAPLYLRASAEAAAKEGAAGRARARFQELLAQAGIKALPGPGQSSVAAKGYPAPERLYGMPPELVTVNEAPNVVPTAGAPRTVQQQMAMDALNTERGGPKQIVLRAANDINVRSPEYVPPPLPRAAAAPSAIATARGLTESNTEVQSLMRMLAADPQRAALMENPTSYEGLEALYHAANARIRDLTGSTARSRVQERALGNIASTFLKAMEEIAPTARTANRAYAQLSQPAEAFEFGMGFDKLTPETLHKAVNLGVLPDGKTAPVESIRLGVVQRLRELLVKRAGSQALAGDAKEKATLAGLNSEQLNRQLKVVLKDKYDDMVPVLRQLLREEGTRMTVTGGKSMAENIAPEGASAADLFGAFMGGIGFSPKAAARRAAGAAAKMGLMERAAVGFGKGATARARMLTATDRALDDWLTAAAAPQRTPLEEALTRAGGGRLARAITTGLLMQRRE